MSAEVNVAGNSYFYEGQKGLTLQREEIGKKGSKQTRQKKTETSAGEAPSCCCCRGVTSPLSVFLCFSLLLLLSSRSSNIERMEEGVKGGHRGGLWVIDPVTCRD